MKLISFGNKLINQLVPAVDAHAGCKIYGGFCYCLNGKRYQRICSVCDGGGGQCSACMPTTLAC